jgi:hypothetical protein
VWSAVCNKVMSSVGHLFDLLVDIKLLCHVLSLLPYLRRANDCNRN